MPNSRGPANSTSDWGEPVSGTIGCPFCEPLPSENEYSYCVARLQISEWRLMRNQANRGTSILVFAPRHVESFTELSTTELYAFAADLQLADRCISRVCQPDLMNYAALGNLVAHLHWHLIPRYRSESRWGMPVWTSRKSDMARAYLSATEYADLCARLRTELEL